MQMDPSVRPVKAVEKPLFETGKKAGEELGFSTASPTRIGKAEEVGTANLVKGKRGRRKKAQQGAGKIDVMRAVVAAGLAGRKAREAARTAKEKTEEAEEAWRTARAKAEEAEEAAKIAQAAAEEAARATEAADEARRLKDKETEWAQCEEELVASNFRPFWNRHFANMHGISFHETTSIPAMCYTYPTPDDERYTRTMETMQIVSVKVTAIKEPLLWPLQVFGIVAVRDVLDHKRNIIFQRPRNNCQHISEDDPYLALTGPSRAVAVSMKPTYIEVSLKVKGTAKSDDKDLSELLVNYRSGCVLCGVYPSRLSTLELKHDIIMHSVEATICIKVTGGSWPDGFRGVFSTFTSSADDLKVKLLDFGHDGLPVDDGDMIKLTRSVVSVGLEEMLKVSAMACPMNKEQVCESSEASFKPAKAGISPPGVELKIGSCSMEVSVAWSLFYPW